jgi:predicted GTPase
VIAVCASRTGTGKSQTSRRVVQLLTEMGVRTVVVRHPMPYGDLARQAVQRFATLADLDRAQVTVEEREDYEPHVQAGSVVFAGVDYAAILVAAQAEAEVLVWDGGNNDLPFFTPDLHITVVDPQRGADLTRFYPGEINVRMAHVIVVNKIETAGWPATEQVYRTLAALNPAATVISAASPIQVSDATRIRGQRVLVIEDGPSVTHGGMAYGAGLLAAQRYAAAEIVDPRPYAVGALAQAYIDYPQLGPVLPAMGYGEDQLHDLAESIRRTPADAVLVATPVDLSRIITIQQPTVRVTYALQEIGEPTLCDVLTAFIAQHVADTSVAMMPECP